MTSGEIGGIIAPTTREESVNDVHPRMNTSEIDELIRTLGDAPKVTYAPPSIYPMSAPSFEQAADAERGEQPEGPLGVYAHVPFCNYKCSFCFYATSPVPALREMTRYVEALEQELEWIRPETPLRQLYVGGGTPTALPPELLDRLLEAVFARVTAGEEVNTVECSPESVREEHVRVLKRHGVERVCMGVQSGEEGIRRTLNRRHGDGQLLDAVELLVGSGLLVNIDLIYGLPGQSEESFRADFALVAERGVHSVTSYNLRINEQTAISRHVAPEQRLDASALVRWREHVRSVARSHGFEQTRWHTFRRAEPATAKQAAQRFRDVTGWGNQYGIGTSARSRLSDVVYRNHGRLGPYLERIEGGLSPVEEVRRLDAFERRLRFVTLTLGDGWSLERSIYQETFGTRFDDDFGEPLERLVGTGIVADEGSTVVLTGRGKLVYDLATRAFYPESVRRWLNDREQLESSAPRRPLKNAPPGWQ